MFLPNLRNSRMRFWVRESFGIKSTIAIASFWWKVLFSRFISVVLIMIYTCSSKVQLEHGIRVLRIIWLNWFLWFASMYMHLKGPSHKSLALLFFIHLSAPTVPIRDVLGPFQNFTDLSQRYTDSKFILRTPDGREEILGVWKNFKIKKIVFF